MQPLSLMHGLACLALAAICLAAPANADITISGRVTFEDKPVANAAVRLTYPCSMSDTVFYPTSRWRRSSAVVRTDADGRFSVQEAERPMCVRCEVAVPGLWNAAASTTITKFTDIPIQLDRIAASRPEHATDVRVKLLDANGQPLAGAVLRVREVRFAAPKTGGAVSSTRAMFGAPEGTPGLLVTNEAGEFDCFSTGFFPAQPADSRLLASSMTFTVDGGPYDGRPFTLTPSPDRAECRLVANAAITGFVERSGVPAADVPVSLVPPDAEWLMDDVPWTVRTDAVGKFTIENVWPGVPLSLYIPVSQPGGAGGSSRVSIDPLAPAERRDAGAVQLRTPRTINGAITTADRITLPAGAGLSVTIVETKEVFIVPLIDTGAFKITGLPDGAQVRLMWAVSNALRNSYIISPDSPSRSLYIGALEGIVDRDIDNFQLRYEKVPAAGPFGASPYDRPFRSINDPLPGEG